MYELSKKSREGLKSKARRLAAGSDAKVDSSDWTPAPLLRAEMKTGARPIIKPSSKGVGESNKAADTKSALGSAHRGAFKDGGGVFDKKALGEIDPKAKRPAVENYKKGGKAEKRTARATGGRAKNKGKASISINILAGTKAPGAEGAPPIVPRTPTAPMPMLQGPPPGAVPPAPMPNVDPRNIQTPAARNLPIALKTGGRVSKTASSYKDMKAGAESGIGRLQKTSIAAKHKDAPARKAGGRISKVAKSYKDMTAGAESGEGRLQKQDIAKAKKIRAA